jgi:hypothetical protein
MLRNYTTQQLYHWWSCSNKRRYIVAVS